ncbi:E3 SUMO-protein ligase ZBED1-like isoform X1 [Amphibalanus amphitrite]|uniref:E3 SUMO-protein ligase ZBED1-like isoform X1 n=1 Tax=Amphibalanus amphitrite TaxID=1232801 RepID=UPI001C901F4A|nr:E3 SUMO-protein ligase ZBED1-like isoform X1 [Amphibalanus amphitrite]
MSSRAPCSAALTLFEHLDNFKYKCKICHKVVIVSASSKTNLNRHAKNKHSQDLENVVRLRGTSTTPLERLVRVPSKSKAEQTTQALIKFVASSHSPLAVVENAEFRAFVASLNESYKLPCRRTLRALTISSAEAVKKELKETLARLPPDQAVSLTMDLWTNRQLLSFLGITAHFVSEKHCLRADLLAFRRFYGAHTAENIISAFEEVTQEFGLRHRIAVVVTDSASNMIRAFRVGFPVADVEDEDEEADNDDDELEATDLGAVEGLNIPVRTACAAHTLQLVVKDGIRECGHGIVSKALTRLNAFIGAARKSSRAMELLSQANASLQSANATRWSSQLRAVRSYLDLSPEVSQRLESLDILRGKAPLGGEKTTLKEVAEVLAPFEVATNVLQGEKVVTSSHVIPVIIGLKTSLLSGEELTTAVRSLQQNLLSSLIRRFTDQLRNPFYVTATLLDPRFKLLPWTDESDAEEARGACAAHLKAEAERRPPVGPSPGRPQPVTITVEDEGEDEPEAVPGPSAMAVEGGRSPTPPPQASGTAAAVGGESSLYAYMHRPRREGTGQSRGAAVEAELARYLSEEPQPMVSDPLKYWAGRKAVFPQLEAAARTHLAITASSGPSERIFSVSGKLFSPARTRLRADIVEGLMHLKCQP